MNKPTWHRSDCSGCPFCDDEMARVMRMDSREYSAWLRGTRRLSAAGRKTMRTTTTNTAPPPPDFAARIREARAREAAARGEGKTKVGALSDGQERLKAAMLSRVSYDHMR